MIACIFDVVPNETLLKRFSRVVSQETSTHRVLLVKQETIHYTQWLQLQTEIRLSGALQGSFLRPQLFNINDLLETAKESESDMLADDTTSHET